MAKISINTETFVADGINEFGDEVGTCEVSLGHKVVTTRARRGKYGVYVAGFVGRYRTSPKAWLATVSQQKLFDSNETRLCVNFGRDDRAGRFHKENAISFEPGTFEMLSNAAAWLPTGSAMKSRFLTGKE